MSGKTVVSFPVPQRLAEQRTHEVPVPARITAGGYGPCCSHWPKFEFKCSTYVGDAADSRNEGDLVLPATTCAVEEELSIAVGLARRRLQSVKSTGQPL